MVLVGLMVLAFVCVCVCVCLIGVCMWVDEISNESDREDDVKERRILTFLLFFCLWRHDGQFIMVVGHLDLDSVLSLMYDIKGVLPDISQTYMPWVSWLPNHGCFTYFIWLLYYHSLVHVALLQDMHGKEKYWYICAHMML